MFFRVLFFFSSGFFGCFEFFECLEFFLFFFFEEEESELRRVVLLRLLGRLFFRFLRCCIHHPNLRTAPLNEGRSILNLSEREKLSLVTE